MCAQLSAYKCAGPAEGPIFWLKKQSGNLEYENVPLLLFLSFVQVQLLLRVDFS